MQQVMEQDIPETPYADSPLDTDLRILGLIELKMKMQNGKMSGKLGELYNALARRFQLVGTEHIELPKHLKYYNLLTHIQPKREQWRFAAMLSPSAFRQRTQLAEKALQQWEGKYDLIFQLHTLQAPGFLSANRPYVLGTDNTYATSLRYWPRWVPAVSKRQRDEWMRLEREVYQNAKFIFPWSEFARQSLINDYGVQPEKVIVLGSGANLLHEDIASKPYDRQMALFVGYEFERKGGMIILEAWEEVHRQLPNAELVIVGPGLPKDLSLPGGVKWLGRVNDRSQLRDLYHNATTFVMPSLFEPYGQSFTEAMGMGLSCIGANHCAMPEFIDHEINGMLIAPGEALPLTNALIRILGDADYARELGHNAYQKMRNSQTWDMGVEKIAPYLRQAAGFISARH